MPGSPDPAPDIAAARLAALGLAATPATRDADAPVFVGGWVPEEPPGDVAAPARARPRHARGESTASTSSLTAALADRLPPWLAGADRPSHMALLSLAAVCALCVGVTGYTVWHRHTEQPPASAPPVASFAPLPSPTPPSIVVDVGGRVRRPGLVTVPLGSRVADALRAAGGALRARDLLSLNLAAKVADGQLLLVGVPVGSMVAGDGSGASTGPVNLNTATVDQLEALPGIGPVLAQHILDWRTAHGSFHSVDQLRDVSGIGDATFADLAPLVTV